LDPKATVAIQLHPKNGDYHLHVGVQSAWFDMEMWLTGYWCPDTNRFVSKRGPKKKFCLGSVGEELSQKLLVKRRGRLVKGQFENQPERWLWYVMRCKHGVVTTRSPSEVRQAQAVLRSDYPRTPHSQGVSGSHPDGLPRGNRPRLHPRTPCIGRGGHAAFAPSAEVCVQGQAGVGRSCLIAGSVSARATRKGWCWPVGVTNTDLVALTRLLPPPSQFHAGTSVSPVRRACYAHARRDTGGFPLDSHFPAIARPATLTGSIRQPG
jgi:hypothetical protein